jgi:hypothetical protein
LYPSIDRIKSISIHLDPPIDRSIESNPSTRLYPSIDRINRELHPSINRINQEIHPSIDHPYASINEADHSSHFVLRVDQSDCRKLHPFCQDVHSFCIYMNTRRNVLIHLSYHVQEREIAQQGIAHKEIAHKEACGRELLL